ncbi:MAG: hypothetical protein H6659_18720 [Ardenticatenaceae bacterium]|nr:hypothetical protein [Ardenticatenaceae bacterium]MCB8987123.1 hypothetical protein [Ardenticatenaceae bacterium]
MTAPTIPVPSEVEVIAESPARPSAWFVALNGFGSGLMWGAVIVSALLAVELDFGIPRILVAALLGFLGFAIISAGEGIILLLRKLLSLLFRLVGFTRGTRFLQQVPAVPLGRILGAFIYIAGDLLWPNSFLQHVTLPVVGEITIVLAGVGVMAVALARMNGRSRPAQIALLAVPAILVLAFVVWVVNPGFDGYVAALPETAVSASLPLANPGLPGPYTVQTLSYGSGSNARRPQFGEAATLTTPSVDGSDIFAGYSGVVDKFFRWYWGFGFDQLPLNGTVWYPVGEGPFPLVLIVHGNHVMSEYSDPGYAYLAEHLASQGYIAVSVDENFLNGLFFFDGGNQEMPLRAWLLLKHLQQWQNWNEAPGTFQGQVDLERIALIGHSRGGEAVAWAAEMNWKDMADISQADDFGFGIRGVVSIAPSDAYAGPNGRRPTLDHTNYMLLAGGHDGDTFVLYGQQQYSRLRFDENPDGFKTLAYVYQGNHGQFNSVWAGNDRGIYNSWLLNRGPLLSPAEQQQAAKVLVTGFLNAALRDEAGYRELFRNPAARDWLPEGIVVTQYQEAGLLRVDTNSGSVKVEATEVNGGTAVAQDMSFAKVETLKLRNGEINQGNKALHLAWEEGSNPVYEIDLPEGRANDWNLTTDAALTFALASVPGEPVAQDVTVELVAAGETARLPLSEFGPIVPPLPAHLVKASWLAGMNGFPNKTAAEEVVLQTYSLPLAAFLTVNPDLQPAQLLAIRFVFDGGAAGATYLDEIGFSLE